MQAFLADKKFAVRVGQATSSPRPVTTSVPQVWTYSHLYQFRRHSTRSSLKGCKLPSDKDLKKKGRDSYVEMETTFEGVSLRAVKWFDNRPVTLLSTIASASPENTVKRFDKTRTSVSITRPSIVGVYNECMGGVDLMDMLVALYRINLRSKKSYRRLFFHLLDTVIVNSWLLYR
ncbi:piggyBac transposable element-derived protein 3-like [Dermacentor andersoni]|uniref:piggyBac transposable element-derived protein 3-like n=1 Tax=Dermacentor andersoni TaxID=34620 RepID=UPI0021555E2A|nr:piggyBac transposable element-derived protein 3-like [Dermacentor andersoni]